MTTPERLCRLLSCTRAASHKAYQLTLSFDGDPRRYLVQQGRLPRPLKIYLNRAIDAPVYVDYQAPSDDPEVRTPRSARSTTSSDEAPEKLKGRVTGLTSSTTDFQVVYERRPSGIISLYALDEEIIAHVGCTFFRGPYARTSDYGRNINYRTHNPARRLSDETSRRNISHGKHSPMAPFERGLVKLIRAPIKAAQAIDDGALIEEVMPLDLSLFSSAEERLDLLSYIPFKGEEIDDEWVRRFLYMQRTLADGVEAGLITLSEGHFHVDIYDDRLQKLYSWREGSRYDLARSALNSKSEAQRFREIREAKLKERRSFVYDSFDDDLTPMGQDRDQGGWRLGAGQSREDLEEENLFGGYIEAPPYFEAFSDWLSRAARFGSVERSGLNLRGILKDFRRCRAGYLSSVPEEEQAALRYNWIRGRLGPQSSVAPYYRAVTAGFTQYLWDLCAGKHAILPDRYGAYDPELDEWPT